MKRTQIIAAVAILAIAAASQVAAQESTTTEAPAAEAPAAPAPAADVPAADAPAADAPAADAPAEGDAAQPDDIVIVPHGDWEVRCESETNCFMYQLTRDSDLNPVAEISIVPLPEGGEATAGVTVVTPLGTLLTEGVVLQVDSGRAVKYEFGWCTRAGCFARFGLTPVELDGMRRGKVAKLRIVAVSAADRPVILDVSLSGFTAAYTDLADR